jgi:hypothetical protein
MERPMNQKHETERWVRDTVAAMESGALTIRASAGRFKAFNINAGYAAKLLHARGYDLTWQEGLGSYQVHMGCQHSSQTETYRRLDRNRYNVTRRCNLCNEVTANLVRFGGETALSREVLSDVHVPFDEPHQSTDGGDGGDGEDESMGGEGSAQGGEGEGPEGEGEEAGTEGEAGGEAGDGETEAGESEEAGEGEGEESEAGEGEGEEGESRPSPATMDAFQSSDQSNGDPWMQAFWKHWEEALTPKENAAAKRRVSMMGAPPSGSDAPQPGGIIAGETAKWKLAEMQAKLGDDRKTEVQEPSVEAGGSATLDLLEEHHMVIGQAALKAAQSFDLASM